MISCPLPAKLDPMDLALYSKNTSPEVAFLELLFPSTKLDGKTNISIADQTLPVLNETELTLWFNKFFDQPEVELSLKGKPTVHLGKLKYSEGLDKTIKIPSLNYLSGFNLTDLDFSFNRNATNSNMKGVLNIPNAGVLTLGLGDLQFNVLAGSINLGLINLTNLVLNPGNNTVPFVGNFFFDELVPNLKDILDSQKEALGNGYIELFATGNSTKVDGIHIPYLEGVLNNKRIRFTIPVISLLGDVLSGVLGADQGSLLDIVGEAVGNKTLLDNILGRFDGANQPNNNATKSSLLRRQKSSQAWKWNLLRLGTRLNKVTM
ncbi:hypothetical protein E8E13_000655 [Curvularia kusanoi]|uniref:Uncharacterized protein n=1 Tax=Curvularia kusanoi TaxID=90978 RepID=A0A9P4WDT4_CURKU|nr:hypothetical protein E8E13_000655 [Curvularia kusanoi]